MIRIETVLGCWNQFAETEMDVRRMCPRLSPRVTGVSKCPFGAYNQPTVEMSGAREEQRKVEPLQRDYRSAPPICHSECEAVHQTPAAAYGGRVTRALWCSNGLVPGAGRFAQE